MMEVGEKLTRRSFLKATSLGFLLIPPLKKKVERVSPSVQGKPKAILVDVRRCVGCKACQVACKSWNNLPAEETEIMETEYTNPTSLSATTWNYIRFEEVENGGSVKWTMVSMRCMHCLEPTCVSVCPTMALWKREDGPVLYNVERCIGCRYCVNACPWGVPSFDDEAKAIRKCTMCFDRIDVGLKPACVTVCQTEALQFGDRDEILEKARNSGAPYIYGEKEAGGTSVIYVSDVPLKEIGLPKVDYRTPSAFNLELLKQFFGIGIVSLIIVPVAYYLLKRGRKTE
ncbi:MAG: 4Fe-4S dicluster domain-containing protein [Candidatus Hecatellales archaeon]|nr:MAG: 4Fe-4S dicluster domain-containing protein [Candidatus Hecatellales archaeon]